MFEYEEVVIEYMSAVSVADGYGAGADQIWLSELQCPAPRHAGIQRDAAVYGHAADEV